MTSQKPLMSLHHSPVRRRGTIMIFVLGILTLLALVGIVLIARTHGESRRIQLDVASQSSDSVMTNVVTGIQETLWRDIWGPFPEADPRPLDDQKNKTDLTGAPVHPNFPGVLENNEAFDAPGEHDRWLASTTPYLAIETDPARIGYGQPQLVPTWNDPLTPPPGYPPELLVEKDVLVWRNVSYVGSALHDPEFAWAANSRSAAAIRVGYSESSTENVTVLQTPPPPPPPPPAGIYPVNMFDGPMIPGSTTNVTIRNARDIWSSGPHSSVGSRFPYFDTNADGVLDLYDADGDGIPDSPLSIEIPIDTPNPNAPRTLYAAVRIVDHSSMLNLNVASSTTFANGAAMFDETLPGLQRRGQRTTEMLLDDLVHRRDGFTHADRRTARLVNHRNNVSTPDPVAYDANVVRTALAGGPANPNVVLYALSEEASLRHRGLLVPYGRRLDYTFPGYDTVDRALPFTLQWTRQIDPLADWTYVGPQSRWTRFNAQWGDAQGLYEGFDDTGNSNIKGWRTLLQEDEPYGVKRHLLTTVSHAAEMPPDITRVSFPFSNLTQLPGETLTEFRQRQFRELGMDWPVLNTDRYPSGPTLSAAYESASISEVIPEWARAQRIDLNMGSTSSPNGARADFLRYAAAAMYLSLEGITEYQGIPLVDDPITTNVNEALNREWLSWQFAVNLVDYRDYDDIPTIYEWRPGLRVYGVEKQPLFTEAYAHLLAGPPTGSPRPASRPGDRWFFAVELFIPPYWQLPSDRLYIRTTVTGSGPGAMLPLSSFLSVGGSFPPPLDGGTTGRWIVLCGSTNDAPTSIDPNVLNTYYRNPAFNIATDGRGSVELVYSELGTAPGHWTEHVIDSIGPRYSGQGNTNNLSSFASQSGMDDWARKPAGMQEDQRMDYSLIRSTRGWRFSTAWHRYATLPPPPRPASLPPLRMSLGLPNKADDNLDKLLPESIWPGRAQVTNSLPGLTSLDTFGQTLPFRDFDSVGDLSKILIIGPTNRSSPAEPPYLRDMSGNALDPGAIPVTELMAEMVATTAVNDPTSGGDLPGDPLRRVAVGRIDFVHARHQPAYASSLRWTHRLADLLTTRSMMFDGIDNDGDGRADVAWQGVAPDPAEGVRLLFRVAGGINLNTAPASVLRTVPHVSMLPGSAENMLRYGSAVNPAIDFINPANTGRYWDLATAMVARREVRPTPLRLWNPAGQRLDTVSVARRESGMGRPNPLNSGAFRHLMEVSTLNHLTGASGDPADPFAHCFHVDRFFFQPSNLFLQMYDHRVNSGDPDAGLASPVSPDFRTKRYDADNDGAFDFLGGDAYLVEYTPVPPPPSPATGYVETGGIRARDVFLARWPNVLTTRSDVFTAYIALIDENGNYVQRSQVTLDRSECFRAAPTPGGLRNIVLPRILTRESGSYSEAVQ